MHAPGTKLNDGYASQDGQPDLTQFCRIIHDSDVAVIAITDYFSFNSYFDVKDKYVELYPSDDKLLLPNLELRMPVAVNQHDQEVNLHLIFNPSLTRDQASKFLGHLKTAATTGTDQLAVTCADLKTKQDFQSATVSSSEIDAAIKATFGEHAIVPAKRQEHLLVISSAKGDGIRAGGSGRQRKNLLSDEIDKFSDAFFGNAGSRDYFLGTERLETDELVAPKPVFDGCDAHSFDDLTAGLGKQVAKEGRQCSVTWIKADPTYQGILQTLIEPADRVAIQTTAPDQKEPYKVISAVRFGATTDFPSQVVFNRNLSSIIGSRSSGKSALLAFIAHTIDPDATVRTQVEASGLHDAKEAGPAAGFTWQDVSDITCEVEWDSGADTKGKVIYIPQNSLYALSEHPEEITKKIAPALFRTYQDVRTAYDNTTSKVSAANADIRSAVDAWFELGRRVDERTQSIVDLGDKAAISAERDRLQTEIDRIRAATALTDEEVTEYQEVAGELASKSSRLKAISDELDRLSAYVAMPDGANVASILPQTVNVTIAVRPSSLDVPDDVAARIDDIKARAAQDFIGKVEAILVEAVTELETERARLRAEIQLTRTDKAQLIGKHETNEELTRVVGDHKKQVSRLEEISKSEKSRDTLAVDQGEAATRIVKGIGVRETALSTLKEVFTANERVLTDLRFGIEAAVPDEAVEHASIGFNRRNTNDYIKNRGDSVAYEDAQADPTKFLSALRGNEVTLNKDYEQSAVAADVLTLTKEVRFSAELDEDRIGGFSRSSMTPGKQALFALTLILNESQEPWPLLIDQPEDDLDSRSIYDTIVPYLVRRKKERQIIMVSHNANLVIGADSEQVIVANRHGDDRKNKDGRTFEYFSGALEHSQPLKKSSPTALGQLGIREHACQILDGGEEAFRKRREKYNM